MVEVNEGLIAQRRCLPAHERNTQEAGLLGSFIIYLGASCFPSLWTAGHLNCLWINSLASYLPPCSKWSAFRPEKSHYLWQRWGKQSTKTLSKCAAITIMQCLLALYLCGPPIVTFLGCDIAWCWKFLLLCIHKYPMRILDLVLLNSYLIAAISWRLDDTARCNRIN